MPKLLITFIKLYEPITQYQAIHWDILWGQPSIFMRQWNCCVWNQGVTDDLWQRRACFGRTFSAPSPQVGGNHAISDCRDHIRWSALSCLGRSEHRENQEGRG